MSPVRVYPLIQSWEGTALGADPEPAAAVKQRLRAALRLRRDQLDRDAHARASALVGDRVRALDVWHRAASVAGYFAAGSELDIDALLVTAATAGKQVWCPRIGADGTMTFHRWQPGDPLDLWRSIRQPLALAPTCNPADIDVFVLPLTACDRDGNRLGSGGGYYDRCLVGSRGFRCGVGFGLQRLTTVPSEAHDIKLDAFVWESGMDRWA